MRLFKHGAKSDIVKGDGKLMSIGKTFDLLLPTFWADVFWPNAREFRVVDGANLLLF